ncbi:hypothetical protein BRADI_3g11823v3 [Brachypodium distachyon]|uniref:Uncharacterized protein n=1 Tax=Brachypodium distachyon TaxID=15368 RepID=A0A2K2CWP2_BRADI|nr:hypothetical protein BRADI_3g11823v3 [Brachypodium distachyon]
MCRRCSNSVQGAKYRKARAAVHRRTSAMMTASCMTTTTNGCNNLMLCTNRLKYLLDTSPPLAERLRPLRKMKWTLMVKNNESGSTNNNKSSAGLVKESREHRAFCSLTGTPCYTLPF